MVSGAGRQVDPAFGFGFAAAAGDGGGVEVAGQALDFRGESPVPPAE
jgi:hypothetical protein